MSDAEQRSSRAERVFRRANARLADTYREFSPAGLTADGHAPFICECSDPRCTRIVQLTLEEYADVRADPRHYVVVPGHVVRDFERVVEENDRYAVLAQDGAATRSAEMTNSY